MQSNPQCNGNDGRQTPPSELVDRPLINLDAVRNRVGHDERLLRMLVRFFVADAPGLCQQLRDAAAARQPSEMRQVAHKLKGLAANLDAHLVMTAADQLERLDESLPWNQIDRLVNELTENVDDVMELLEHSVLEAE